MHHLVRWLKSVAIIATLKRALARLPAPEQEQIMNVLKSFFANSAQIAKLIVLVAATLTGLHWLPSITPLLGPLSDAIAAHDYTAIFGDALAIFAAAVALFQGHVEIERHEEKLAMMAMQAQPNMPVASTVRAMRHACKVA